MALIEMNKQHVPSKVLHEKYIVPPFSVFDTHQPYMRNRMKYWRDLGLCGTNGRVTNSNGLTYDNRRMDRYALKQHNMTAPKDGIGTNGTSTFNPVVAEVVYKWFTLPHSNIYDPFAGGITRGGIAAFLGHSYIGTDVNTNQVSSNYLEWEILDDKWLIEGDTKWLTMSCLDYVPEVTPDLIFTCPPYYNLEKYTDLDTDFSNTESYEDFLENYVNCINLCYNILADDSFMVWVVSDVRDKKTTEYYGLVADTIKSAQHVGFKFYNEIILYNDTGNLAIVSGDYLERARKVGRQHQNILVFYKGDTKNIKEKYGPVTV